MHIYVAKTLPRKLIVLYELHHFFAVCLKGHGKRRQQRKDLRPVSQIPAGQFSNNKEVTSNVSVIQETLESWASLPQVCYPY